MKLNSLIKVDSLCVAASGQSTSLHIQIPILGQHDRHANNVRVASCSRICLSELGTRPRFQLLNGIFDLYSVLSNLWFVGLVLIPQNDAFNVRSSAFCRP